VSDSRRGDPAPRPQERELGAWSGVGASCLRPTEPGDELGCPSPGWLVRSRTCLGPVGTASACRAAPSAPRRSLNCRTLTSTPYHLESLTGATGSPRTRASRHADRARVRVLDHVGDGPPASSTSTAFASGSTVRGTLLRCTRSSLVPPHTSAAAAHPPRPPPPPGPLGKFAPLQRSAIAGPTRRGGLHQGLLRRQADRSRRATDASPGLGNPDCCGHQLEGDPGKPLQSGA